MQMPAELALLYISFGCFFALLIFLLGSVALYDYQQKYTSVRVDNDCPDPARDILLDERLYYGRRMDHMERLRLTRSKNY